MPPNILKNAYTRIDFDRRLVYRYFLEFSIFENALKQTAYRREGRNGSLEADWHLFALSLIGRFNRNKNKNIRVAVNYFIDHPVNGQFIKDGEIVFRRVDDGLLSTEEMLSIQIRRVRNNLFHGAKFEYHRPRDTDLLRHALVILEDWVDIQPEIREVIGHLN
jgi:hypothetical protein